MPRRTSALAKPAPPPQAPALVVASLAEIERAIGGRDALVAALLHAPRAADLDYLLGLLGHPASARIPLADLCARGGITAGEVIKAYTAGEIARAGAVATQRIGEKLPAVAEDTMRLALPHDITCPSCKGTGSITPEPTKKVPNPPPEPCESCGATGTLGLQGDLEHKKLALEMGKLLHKGGGLNLQVNQQQVTFTGAAAGGALEKMQAATDAILYGDGPLVAMAPPTPLHEVVEGEVEEASIEEDWRGTPEEDHPDD